MTPEEAQARAVDLARNSALIQLTTNTRNLSRARYELTAALYEMVSGEKYALNISQQWNDQLNRETEAIRRNTIASIQGVATAVAGLIGGRRAEAAVEGAFSAAKAIQMWARFFGSRFTDWPAALSAVQYTISAAQFFKIAGTSSGPAKGGGAGGAGTGAEAGAGAPGGGGAGTGTTTEKRQPTVQIIFQGPVYGGQAGIDQLVQDISQAVQERDVNLTAYTVVRQPARRA
jgi:hypothetical protein